MTSRTGRAAAVVAAAATLALTASTASAGVGWTVTSTYNVPGDYNVLRAVSCPSGGCWAVGDHFNYSRDPLGHALIEEHTSGGWRNVATPADTGGDLLGIDCLSLTDCWAVGARVSASHGYTLIEHYDGNSWRIVGSPNTTQGIDDQLTSVVCTSATLCWAVGSYVVQGSNLQRTLIEAYTGAQWKVVSRPPAATLSDSETLVGVGCRGANDCWAVGIRTHSDQQQVPLVYHYGGGSWTAASAPTTAPGDSEGFWGINCAQGGSCWAVGDNFPANGGRVTFIERNTGSGWQVVSSPTPAGDQALLTGVACGTANDCWAVGGASGNNSEFTLVERWNGAQWSVVPAPNKGFAPELWQVSCDASRNCASVGQDGTTPQNVLQTLAEMYYSH